MGAFQIEKQMKEGDIESVMEKAMATIKKQFGKIVSVDEAAGSEQSARQLVRQRSMLQQGPLGQFAGSEQDASRMLEAFRMKDEGKSTAKLSDTILQDTMATGVKIQETSTSIATKQLTIIENAQLSAIVPALNTIQQLMGNRVGSSFFQNAPGQGQAEELRQSRRETMSASARSGGSTASQLAGGLAGTSSLKNMSGEILAGAFKEQKQFFSEVGKMLGVATDTLYGVFTTSSAEAAKKAKEYGDQLNSNIAIKQEQSKGLTGDDKRRADAEISRMQATSSMYNSRLEQRTDLITDATRNSSRVSASQQVGAAIPGTIKATAPKPQSETATGGAATGQGQTKESHVHVSVTGWCVECKRKIESSAQGKSNNPQVE